MAPPRPFGNGYNSVGPRAPLMGEGYSSSNSAGDFNPRNRPLRDSASHIDCSDFYEQDFIDDEELDLQRMLTGQQRPFSFHSRTSTSSTPVPLGRSPIPFHRIDEGVGQYDVAHRSPFDSLSASQTFQARESSGFAAYDSMYQQRSFSLPCSRQSSMLPTQQASPASALHRLHTVAGTRASTSSHGYLPHNSAPVRDSINMVLAEILRPGTAGVGELARSFDQQQQRMAGTDTPRDARGGGATPQPQRQEASRAPRSQRCQNCDTEGGNTWRISKLDGSLLCNACGYVESLTNLFDIRFESNVGIVPGRSRRHQLISCHCTGCTRCVGVNVAL